MHRARLLSPAIAGGFAVPVKRRVAKARALDQFALVELRDGPGACLIRGCGYYAAHGGTGLHSDDPGGFYWEVSPDAQAGLLEQMRADWQRVGARLIAETDDPAAIWAFREFGAPDGWVKQ